MLRVGRHENIFILFLLAIKITGSAQKLNVGRVSGNTAIFIYALHGRVFTIINELTNLSITVCIGMNIQLMSVRHINSMARTM